MLTNALSNYHQVAAKLTYAETPNSSRMKRTSTNNYQLTTRMLDDDIHNLDCIETTEERNPSPLKIQNSICDKNHLATVIEEAETAQVICNCKTKL